MYFIMDIVAMFCHGVQYQKDSRYLHFDRSRFALVVLSSTNHIDAESFEVKESSFVV